MSYSVVLSVRHLKGYPPWCSAADAGVWGESGYRDGSAPPHSQQYHLASRAAWFSSTGVSHHSLLYPVPLGYLSAFNSRPHPRIAPQWLHSSSLPATVPSRGPASRLEYVWQELFVWFSLHLDCHRSTASLSASNVSPLSQTIAPMLGLDPGFSSPTWQRQIQSYLLSSFPPNFLRPTKFCMVLCILFCGSGSSARSQLALQALLCLKVYSWCIYECTPHLPIPPLSCSSRSILYVLNHTQGHFTQ